MTRSLTSDSVDEFFKEEMFSHPIALMYDILMLPINKLKAPTIQVNTEMLAFYLSYISNLCILHH